MPNNNDDDLRNRLAVLEQQLGLRNNNDLVLPFNFIIKNFRKLFYMTSEQLVSTGCCYPLYYTIGTTPIATMGNGDKLTRQFIGTRQLF